MKIAKYLNDKFTEKIFDWGNFNSNLINTARPLRV